MNNSNNRKNSTIDLYEVIGHKFEKISYSLCYGWIVIPVIMSVVCAILHYTYRAHDDYVTQMYSSVYVMITMTLGTLLLCYWLFAIYEKKYHFKTTLVGFTREKAGHEVWLLLLLGLWFWSLVCALCAEDLVIAFKGTTNLSEGFYTYCIFAATFGCAYMIDDDNKKLKLIRLYVTVTNILAILMYFQENQIPILKEFNLWYETSVFLNSNHYGYVLSMSLMCIVGLYYRTIGNSDIKGMIKYGISFLLQMYILMINNTFGAYLAICLAMVMSIVIILVRKEKIRWMHALPFLATIVLTVISALGLMHNYVGQTIGESCIEFMKDLFKVAKRAEGYEKAGTNRIFLWKEALKLIPKHPLVGVGPEGLTGEYFATTGYTRPHNEYIQWAVFCGIPGLALYLSALITLCVNRVRRLKSVSDVQLIAAFAVIGYLISAFFGNTKYYITPYFLIFLGMIANGAKNNECGD